MGRAVREGAVDEERPPAGQVAVFIDFENLVLGAGKGLPGQANPVPYAALARLCHEYGNASVRRAYAGWADPRFGRYQDDLALNGVDMTQVGRVGAQAKNAAGIQMAVDAMETLIARPDVAVFVLVTGDGDYTPLVRRLREFGTRAVGVGTEATASRRLSLVCSEYKFWGTLVAEVDPASRAAVDAAFDITAAEQQLVRAFEETARTTLTASAIKGKMVALDSSFYERNYGRRSFRDFLDRFPGRVRRAGRSGSDITLAAVSDELRGNWPGNARIRGGEALTASEKAR
jgi:hypothetical protein